MKGPGIMHETPNGYVLRVGVGHYEVYKHTLTHAVRMGTYHFSSNPHYALCRAIERCNEL